MTDTSTTPTSVPLIDPLVLRLGGRDNTTVLVAAAAVIWVVVLLAMSL